jgi:hypothetical protein
MAILNDRVDSKRFSSILPSEMMIHNPTDGLIPSKHVVLMVNGMPKKVISIVVYEFLLGDVEDPIVYMAEPLLKWENSEAGQYILAKAIESPYWHRHVNHESYTTRVLVIARLFEEDASYYALKFL